MREDTVKLSLSAPIYMINFIKRMSDIELFGEPETGVDLENTEDQVFEPMSPFISLCKDKEGSLET